MRLPPEARALIPSIVVIGAPIAIFWTRLPADVRGALLVTLGVVATLSVVGAARAVRTRRVLSAHRRALLAAHARPEPDACSASQTKASASTPSAR